MAISTYTENLEISFLPNEVGSSYYTENLEISFLPNEVGSSYYTENLEISFLPNEVGSSYYTENLEISFSPAPGTPPTITTTSPLPDATVGVPYEQYFDATGDDPKTWTNPGGGFPTGLEFSQVGERGLLSGIPTGIAGVYTGEVRVQNSFGHDQNSFELTLLAGDPPTNGSVVINSGDDYTTSSTVTLIINGTVGTNPITKMMISNYEDFHDASWETYNTSKTWTLLPEYANKTVYVKLGDDYGRESESFSDTIYYIRLPQALDIRIDGKVTPHISNYSPLVSWSYQDTGLNGVQYSYRVQVSTSETFETIIYDSDTVISSSTSHRIPTLSQLGTFYVRVKVQEQI